jgi:hypothetical protein
MARLQQQPQQTLGSRKLISRGSMRPQQQQRLPLLDYQQGYAMCMQTSTS